MNTRSAVVPRILSALRRRPDPIPDEAVGIEYWTLRAQRLGSFGVLNSSHKRRREAEVTERQRVKLARTIRRHRDGILNAIRLGLNSRIRLISHRSFGFHSANPLIALVYLCWSRIAIPLPR